MDIKIKLIYLEAVHAMGNSFHTCGSRHSTKTIETDNQCILGYLGG